MPKIELLSEIPPEVKLNPDGYVKLWNNKYEAKDSGNELICINDLYYILDENKHIKDAYGNWINIKHGLDAYLILLKGKPVLKIFSNTQPNKNKSEIIHQAFLEAFVERKDFNAVTTSRKVDLVLQAMSMRVSYPFMNGKKKVTLPCTTLIPFLEELGFNRDHRNGAYSIKKSKSFEEKTEGSYERYNARELGISNKIGTNIIGKNDYTFGVEIETARGLLTSAEAYGLDMTLECTRDGSITGGEYVTGILKGDKGFYDLYKLCHALSPKTDGDARCGIHVHIGNVKFNDSFNCAAYILGVKIQNELLGFLHPSRSKNNMCGLLDTKFLAGAHEIYNNNPFHVANELFYQFLFKKMTYGKKLGKNSNKRFKHAGGRYCERYQRFSGRITNEQFRYKWLNLISCNFNQRGRTSENRHKVNHNVLTLEFRPYQSTLDYREIETWVLFCMAYTTYVVAKPMDILANKKKITVKEVCDFSSPNLYDRMLVYKENPMINRKTPSAKLRISQLIKAQKVNVSNNT